jgi:hypothetical protein
MPASPTMDRGLKPVTVGVQPKAIASRLGPAEQHFVGVTLRGASSDA